MGEYKKFVRCIVEKKSRFTMVEEEYETRVSFSMVCVINVRI